MKSVLLLSLLITAALQDIRSGIISNRLIATGLVIGFVIQITEYQVRGIYYYLRNISVPVILLYLLFQMRVLGAGDIKLFSMIGSIVTIQELGRCILFGFAAGGLMAFILLAADRRRWERLKCGGRYLIQTVLTGRLKPYVPPETGEVCPFPFSVPILFGVIGALYVPVGY